MVSISGGDGLKILLNLFTFCVFSFLSFHGIIAFALLSTYIYIYA